MLIYLLACFIKGLRFAHLFRQGSRLELETGIPFQQAYALNNVSFFYLSDIFIYWFYRPFIPGKRLAGAIAIARVADALILGAGFSIFAFRYKGIWMALFLANLLWGCVCAVELFRSHRKLLRRRFAQVFTLSAMGWGLEWLALATAFALFQGLGAEAFIRAFDGVLRSFVLGPQFVYHWFFLVHFILGFASLLLVDYPGKRVVKD